MNSTARYISLKQSKPRLESIGFVIEFRFVKQPGKGRKFIRVYSIIGVAVEVGGQSNGGIVIAGNRFDSFVTTQITIQGRFFQVQLRK